MAAVEEVAYHGTWKIIECVSVAGVVETTGIEGTEFILDENGDVSWQVADEAEPLPFFHCETYEVCPASVTEPALLKFIGTYAGYVVEFKVDISDDLMLLTYEKCCMLQCQKVSSGPRKEDSPYSFLSALEHGYFTDLTLKADNGKEFKAHTMILKLSSPEIDWTAPSTPLSGLPEDVLKVTLHYLYAECLPRGLSESTAQKCCKLVGKLPGFAKFGQLCETFLKNTALTQQMKTLVSDIHTCADKINDLFGSAIGEDGKETVTLEGTMWSNPAKLCYTVRQALREVAVACAKLVIMCDLFSKRKYELSREERYEIMKYVKSRIPVFMKQVLTLLTTVKSHLQALTQPQRTDIAAYLVPEMETILDTMSRFANETKSALEQAITTSNEKVVEKGEKLDKSKRSSVGDALGRTLKHALHLKELKKLKHFHDRTTSSFQHLRQKRENFNMKSQPDKVRSVSQSLVHLVDEFPSFVIRLREIIAALDEKVTWKEWKYLFKMATSKVSWGLAKVQSHRTALQPMIDEMCDIVRSEQFVASLVTLGLKLPADHPSPVQNSSGKDALFSAAAGHTTKYAQLSCVDSLCVSPTASQSCTAKRALELFRACDDTDMVFEVVSLPEGGDIIIDHTASQADGCAGAEMAKSSGPEAHDEVEVHEIRAHRVVVAARCDWFRRALLSGMKEAIDRKIIVHDTNPELFTLFLEALYSGHLDITSLNAEQLADMMTLCDRYEMDSLKQVCEQELKSHLDEENALCLLNLADHLNSRNLRDSALNYVVEHQDITFSEVYDELPDHLKDEVQDAIVWQGLEPRTQSSQGHHLGTPSSTSSLSEVDELVANMDLSQERGLDLSTSSSFDDLQLVEDSARLDVCVRNLRDIVGESVPVEELTRIAFAADYDVNRALNFFFSS
ncbi:LOW QUALITY PROTEIN: uncharacterized protein LOC131927488 [Physella acuta]|uniref:LOW QUALITY PROTEIN: uncharacterized protein LOC131927488 n=1 Tax=Physella acuta TaxID=109671 RepID=UPI0027DC985D|nr:LOW QUALITY PROTEIN: uncharacterized protein LOC131927488 [Physella acuta]